MSEKQMSCALLYAHFNAPGQFRTTLGHSLLDIRIRKEKGDFFLSLFILEKLKMICQRQWYKASWWMGLSYSASQSFTPAFTAILSFCFFSLRKAIISITLHISAKFTVSVHAWPKGRKSHSVWVKFHFLACTCSFFMICSWCGITMWYYFTCAPNIARHGSDWCY